MNELIERRINKFKAAFKLTSLDFPELIAAQAVEAMSDDEIEIFLRHSSEAALLSNAAAFMAGHTVARLGVEFAISEDSVNDEMFDEFVTMPCWKEGLFYRREVQLDARTIINGYLKGLAVNQDV